MNQRAYHHGDLAAALVAEATAEVRATGAEDVSLRRLANAVGVSPSAAYHHFPDKATLLAQVGLAGVELLEERLRAAVAEHPGADAGAAVRRFAAVGRAYLDFADAEPHLFLHMFGPMCPKPEGPPDESGAYQVLLDCLDDLERHQLLRPGIRPGLELLAWTSVHGAAELRLHGNLAEEELDALLEVLLRTFLVAP